MSVVTPNPYEAPRSEAISTSSPRYGSEVKLEILRLSVRGFILGVLGLLMAPILVGLLIAPIAIHHGARARSLIRDSGQIGTQYLGLATGGFSLGWLSIIISLGVAASFMLAAL